MLFFNYYLLIFIIIIERDFFIFKCNLKKLKLLIIFSIKKNKSIFKHKKKDSPPTKKTKFLLVSTNLLSSVRTILKTLFFFIFCMNLSLLLRLLFLFIYNLIILCIGLLIESLQLWEIFLSIKIQTCNKFKIKLNLLQKIDILSNLTLKLFLIFHHINYR